MRAASVLAIVSALLVSPALAETVAIRGGLVFDGVQFMQQDLFIDGEVFVAGLEGEPDRVVDASGKWIVPPFAEAHCHVFLGGQTSIDASKRKLDNGVYYAANLNHPIGVNTSYDRRLQDGEVLCDLSWAQAGITRTECHPVPLYRSIHVRWEKKDPEVFMEAALERVFWIADTPAELESIWSRYLESEPDLVKLYLLESESYDDPDADPVSHKGMSPEVFSLAVEKAHAAGLRAVAHIETARDLERCIEAGIDALGHLPYNFLGLTDEEVEARTISPALARRLADAGIPAMATCQLVEVYGQGEGVDPEDKQRALDASRKNLRTLADAGVTVLVGSDSWVTSSEALAMQRSEAWSNAELLNLWCTETPRFLFPDRKIGSLEPGCEASLIFLGSDPLEDFDAVTSVYGGFKQGVEVAPPAVEE